MLGPRTAVRAAAIVEPAAAEVAEVRELGGELADLLVVLRLRDAPGLEVGVEARRRGLLHRRLHLCERLAVRRGDGGQGLARAQRVEQRGLADADGLRGVGE